MPHLGLSERLHAGLEGKALLNMIHWNVTERDRVAQPRGRLEPSPVPTVTNISKCHLIHWSFLTFWKAVCLLCLRLLQRLLDDGDTRHCNATGIVY